MDLFSVLTLIGGLAMFLYGMDVMGDGLKKLSGSKLETILGKLTANRFKGFLLGFLVTAVIQSSSATTVMLVGFVNSGIMTLGQTISIIMGANVGTTVTSWLLSLSGIGDEVSSVLKLFKPASFTPILAAIGVILNMVGKKDKHKHIGSILLGFAVLMFGMDTMSDAVSGLKDDPSFAQLLIMFQNPVMGILVGTLLTAIIQSSSASVGILQALSLTGTISFSTALPIILGQNIGTTITPILSSLTGNRDSKRVAFSCLYIKMIGVILVTIPFYILNGVFNFTFMDHIVDPVYIATIHTIFNIISTIILIPFCKWLEKLAVATIKGKNEEKTNVFSTLDERFLQVPGFAIEKCRELVCQMAEIANESLVEATKLLYNFDEKRAREIKEMEEMVDTYEDKISTYLVHLAGKNPTDIESREITKILHLVGDIERISDHALNVVEVADEINEKDAKFSPAAQKEIKVITEAACEILSMATEAVRNDDKELAKKVEPLEQIIEKIKAKIKKNHIKRLQDGNCTMEMGFILSDLLNNYERVSDHCSNIAVCILEIANNSFETHEYLSHVKHDGGNDFHEQYAEYKAKYHID